MLIAIYIPASLVMFAGGQWIEARIIRNWWREMFKAKIEKDPDNDLRMAGGFFIVIGGLVIAERDIPAGEQREGYALSRGPSMNESGVLPRWLRSPQL